MMAERVTWTKPIKLTELKFGDLIYVRRMKNGFPIRLTCKFLMYERGLAYVEIIEDTEPKWYREDFPIGMKLKVRQKMLYLWGKKEKEMYPHCHWCKNGVFK